MKIEMISIYKENLSVIKINEIIAHINEKKFSQTGELREQLIGLCNQYFNERNMAGNVHATKTANAVFKLQRSLVAARYLPEANSFEEAQEKMLKSIMTAVVNPPRVSAAAASAAAAEAVSGDQETKPKDSSNSEKMYRTLRDPYLSEARFRGALTVARWVTVGDPRISYEQLEQTRLKSGRDIHYFDDPTRFKLTYHADDQLFYQAKQTKNSRGEFVATEEPANIFGFSGTRQTLGCEFVVDLAGEIYVIPREESGERVRHSSILQGKPVLFAGMCELVGGKFSWISNESGHYQCEIHHFLRFLDELKDKVDLKQVEVKIRTSGTDIYEYSAADFLESRAIRPEDELKK